MARIFHIRDEKEIPQIRNVIKGILDKGRAVRLEIKSTTEKTKNQRAYYFGVIIPRVIEKFEDDGNFDWDEEDIHIFLKSLFLFETKEIGGKFYRMPKSLAKASIEEASEFIAKVCIWCSEQGIFVPLPDTNKQEEVWKI